MKAKSKGIIGAKYTTQEAIILFVCQRKYILQSQTNKFLSLSSISAHILYVMRLKLSLLMPLGFVAEE